MLSFEHSSHYSVTWATSSSSSVNSGRHVQGGNQLSAPPSVTPNAVHTPALGIGKATEPRLGDPKQSISLKDAFKQLQLFTGTSDKQLSLTVSPSVFDEIIDNLGNHPELDNLRYVVISPFWHKKLTKT